MHLFASLDPYRDRVATFETASRTVVVLDDVEPDARDGEQAIVDLEARPVRGSSGDQSGNGDPRKILLDIDSHSARATLVRLVDLDHG